MNERYCPDDRTETAARYVAGRMDADELHDFEVHMLGCATCRAAIRETATVRAALKGSRRRRLRVVVPVAGVAVAAAIAALLLPTSQADRTGVSAPAIRAMAVRSDADSAAQTADSAVVAYQHGQWRAAATLFARSYAANRQPAAAFYLGISQLMAGSPDSAIAALRYTLPVAAYAAESHYYSAKAWLQLERVDSARAHLTALEHTRNREWQERAQALSDSLSQRQ